MRQLKATGVYWLSALSSFFLGPLAAFGQDSASVLRDSLKQGVSDSLAAPQVANAPDMQERMMVLAIGLTILAGFALLLYLKRRELDRRADIL